MRFNQMMRSAVMASVFAIGASLASAATLTLQYNGGTAGGSATINNSPVMPVGGYRTYGAWGFKMTDTSGQMGSFVAWCVDVTHWLSGGTSNYEVTNTPFSNSYAVSAASRARIQSLFDANYGLLDATNNVQAAGFQVALWNSLYDTDVAAAAGAFSVVSGAVATQANAFLAAADAFGGLRAYHVTFLQNTDRDSHQNLVTVSQVPLPAAGLLLVGALGALGAAGKRRRSKSDAAQA